MTDSNEFESQQWKYQLYMQERRHLIDAAREGARSFDRAVLTVASGSFAFSIGVLRDVVPEPISALGWMLGIAWILFGLSIFISLASYLLSHKACHFEIECAEAVVYKGEEAPPNPWSRWTACANYASLGSLALGVVLWGLFVYANLFWRG